MRLRRIIYKQYRYDDYFNDRIAIRKLGGDMLLEKGPNNITNYRVYWTGK